MIDEKPGRQRCQQTSMKRCRQRDNPVKPVVVHKQIIPFRDQATLGMSENLERSLRQVAIDKFGQVPGEFWNVRLIPKCRVIEKHRGYSAALQEGAKFAPEPGHVGETVYEQNRNGSHCV